MPRLVASLKTSHKTVLFSFLLQIYGLSSYCTAEEEYLKIWVYLLNNNLIHVYLEMYFQNKMLYSIWIIL